VLFDVGTVGELTDGQLLERFATARGEAAEMAFAVLVERHGPMVLGVCRSVLVDCHDSQDAFQATFLVLVKKARGLWVRDSLGPWLHQVAFRTASSARRVAARRTRHERNAAAEAVLEIRDPAGEDLGPVVHEEIERLPERFRRPVVLCDLEGCTQEQAARYLGWPIGTVKSRLARGRERLRDRFRRRGLAPEPALLATGVGLDAPTALLSRALVDATARAAVQFATTQAIVPGSAAVLAQGVLRAMFMTRWLKIASIVFGLGAAGVGVELWGQNKGPAGGVETSQRAVAAPDDLPTMTVRRGKLRATEFEPGVVAMSRSYDAVSQVEGTTEIVRLHPEDTEVKKGELVCELDSAGLRDTLLNQIITAQGAESSYKKAKSVRETAELAVVEYSEGILPVEKRSLQDQVAAAESAIRKAEARVKRTREARRTILSLLTERERGRVTTPADVLAELDVEDRLQAAEESLDRARMALDQAKAKLNLLVNYTGPKTIKELRAGVEPKRLDELTKQAMYDLQFRREASIRPQIDACKIVAPADGLLVYSRRPSIGVGALVVKRQKILQIVDPKSPFLVNTKVPHSMIKRVAPGLRVHVKVDALAGQVLNGVVKEVSPTADAFDSNSGRSFDESDRVYFAQVVIENPPPALSRDMVAQVEIVVAELNDVLTVPAQAVLGNHVGVRSADGMVELRKVSLGLTDGTLVEVTQGIKEGEAVVLDPSKVPEEKRGKSFRPAPVAPRAARP